MATAGTAVCWGFVSMLQRTGSISKIVAISSVVLMIVYLQIALANAQGDQPQAPPQQPTALTEAQKNLAAALQQKRENAARIAYWQAMASGNVQSSQDESSTQQIIGWLKEIITPIALALISAYFGPKIQAIKEARMGDRIDEGARRLAPDLLNKLIRAGKNLGATAAELMEDNDVRSLAINKGEMLLNNYPEFSKDLKQNASSLAIIVLKEALKLNVPAVVNASQPPGIDVDSIAERVRQRLIRNAMAAAPHRPAPTSTSIASSPSTQPVDLKDYRVEEKAAAPPPPTGDAWTRLKEAPQTATNG